LEFLPALGPGADLERTMHRRLATILTLVLIVIAAFGVCFWGAYLFLNSIAVCDTGSPQLAREWAALLEGFPDPEAAQEANARI
jgi:hypothetical protein